MLAQVLAVDEGVKTDAAAIDCCKIFDEQMQSLYLLAFLLTADPDKADACFVGWLGECVEGSGKCMDGLDSWARLAIIRQAIQMIKPTEEQSVGAYFFNDVPATLGASNPLAVIVSLSPFERFVYVMSVVEGQSDEDCQSLLHCSRQEVLMARKAVLRLFAASNSGWEHAQIGKHCWPGLSN